MGSRERAFIVQVEGQDIAVPLKRHSNGKVGKHTLNHKYDYEKVFNSLYINPLVEP